MQAIDLDTAQEIVDFSGGDPQLEALGRLQLEGAVALQNMLVHSEVGTGYLADEVGMGKTYIALGAVAMMRYFNPSYRVLYICPSRNVQEKWHGREHPNFIRKNVLTRNFKIRTPQGDPGTPSISCANVEELIHAATTGYYGDIFVRMSSFSMAMGDDEEGLERQFESLLEHVPASVIGRHRGKKQDIKKAYAKALNYLLPTFDLVVIDEAHNFKHSFESSARNLALSRILGFNDEDGESYRRRVKAALLLSATPFDVEPRHLYNQLNLVGKPHLMPPNEDWYNKTILRDSMARFMVRRLNELRILGVPHTRNMYRREWRKGERAEIDFETDEHKLITALVQKHVGDLLNREGGNPSFQLGLLASFESYAQTTRSGPVEFDGEKAPESTTDARDRHLIAKIRDSYVVENDFGKSLPHPKMDQVSREAAGLAFDQGRKQLIFVRRVKSVGEIKQKLDDIYDDWIHRHIETTLSGLSDQLRFIEAVRAVYQEVRKVRDEDISGGEAVTRSDEEEEHLQPKNDTIFNWFFRGERPPELEQSLARDLSRWPTPDTLKKSLISKNNANFLLFEINWVGWAARSLFGTTIDDLLADLGEQQVSEVLRSVPPVADDDNLSLFLAVQGAVLRVVAERHPELPGLVELLDYLQPLIRPGHYRPADPRIPRQLLTLRTFFCHLQESGLDQVFFGSPVTLAEQIRQGSKDHYDHIHRVEIHRQLVAQSFRTGHPIIDLYLARLAIGEAELSEARRHSWMQQLCRMLDDQRSRPGFSTASELSRLNDHLDLVIKNNLTGIHKRGQDELRRWLNIQLPSNAPVIGANGDTRGSRSIQARKFRMPGYPLVLVSTDVFQEGEDLHTFCDSVIHYGLSSSPISIEQKTGRVDRVGALAHRRLVGINAEQGVTDDDFIQVRFPFVRQSIEAIQVRVLCNKLNTFLGSLHEIGCEGKSIDEFVNSSHELMNRNEIPEQLLDYLKSPYVPPAPLISSPALKKRVEAESSMYKQAVEHVHAMIRVVADIPVDKQGTMEARIAGIDDQSFIVRIDSARSCGEMLLRVTARNRTEFLKLSELTREVILSRQARLYEDALYRTICVRVTDGFDVLMDAEMLVGGPKVTCEDDIVGLFNRFAPVAGNTRRPDEINQILPQFTDDEVSDYLSSRFHWSGTFSSRRHGSTFDLVFKFDENRHRKHHVRIRSIDGCCHFEAMVTDETVVRQFSRDKLLRLTWTRNRNIDLVEFLVRPDGCMVGRALHPAHSMGFDEFVFTAYILAVEADRMEYLVKEPDEY